MPIEGLEDVDSSSEICNRPFRQAHDGRLYFDVYISETLPRRDCMLRGRHNRGVLGPARLKNLSMPRL